MANLVAQPLTTSTGLNWVFLIELVVCGILALFFLFYFNRLFATIISYGIRAWAWHKYRAYIDVSALQFSLLGGRLFFKSVRYHAHNITVIVRDGHITWRYWLSSVQEAEIFAADGNGSGSQNEKASSPDGSREERHSSIEGEKPRSRSIGKEESGTGTQKRQLPARISVRLSAVEAFIYNRSPAFDSLVDQTVRKAHTSNDVKGPTPRSSTLDGQSTGEDVMDGGVVDERIGTHESPGMSPIHSRPSNPQYHKPELPSWIRVLPVKIECKRAAAAVGNEHTTSVIVAKLERAVGTVDAGHAGPLDLYKLLFNFEFETINVAMKPNHDFKEPQLTAAQRILREQEQSRPSPRSWPYQIIFDRVRRRWHKLVIASTRKPTTSGSLRAASMTSEQVPAPAAPQDQLPGEAQWRGLARYMDDRKANEHDEWKPVEYAKASTLADIPRLSFRFYWDIPGQIPDVLANSQPQLSATYQDDMNGSKPPEYGLDFGVHGGVVVYGPWADRQRQNLQPIFFPASHVDAIPAEPLKPGDTRVPTMLKIFVCVEEDVILRLPTREESKDIKWAGRADKSKSGFSGQDEHAGKKSGKHSRRRKRRKGKQSTPGIDARPYGWIDVTVKTDTTVNYVMDMFPRPEGFKNTLGLDVKGIEMTSSVNHGLLWRSGSMVMDADLSYPLSWNTTRDWPFNITCDDLELFILRDHLFLIIDLVNDWASGPPPEFYTFVPFFYHLNLVFRNFCIYLNVNDANIINDPAQFDVNDFLTLEGKSLHGVLGIPLEYYRPKHGGVEFDVLAHEMKMRILSPVRSTLRTLVKEKQVAELPKLTLKGAYTSNTEQRRGNTDILQFDIVGTGLDLKAYGFLVRQLINIKENYFGDYAHFKTLEEFQDASDDFAEANAKTASIPKPKSINELDVILRIIAEEVTIMLPTNLYNCEEYVRVEVPRADIDLRITSYYLDMGLNISPISFLVGSSKHAEADDSPIESASSTQIHIGHVDLDGHRAFGLPPNEPAYVSQWDIDVGNISGECSSAFFHDIVLALQAFAFTFQDGENALPVTSPNVSQDVTFVKVRSGVLRLWLHVGKDALLVSTDPVAVTSHDRCGERFSQSISVIAPLITLAIVEAHSASTHRVGRGQRILVRTYAFLQTGASINVVGRKTQFEAEKRKQQDHIKRSDRRTGRVPFLIDDSNGVAGNIIEGMEDDTDPPAIPYPSLPDPVDQSGVPLRQASSLKSIGSVGGGQRLNSKASISSLSAPKQSRGTLLRPLPMTARSTSSRDTRSFASMVSSKRGSSSDAAPSRRDGGRIGLHSSTIAFSSSFAEPYFPFDAVDPDEIHVPSFPSIDDTTSSDSDSLTLAASVEGATSENDAERVGVIVRLQPGLRAYLEPRAIAAIAKLARKAAPKSPEEVMDGFQMEILNAVVHQQQQQRDQSSILDLHVHLPAAHLRIQNLAEDQTSCGQVDVEIGNLEQTIRMRKQSRLAKASVALSLHIIGDGVKLSLSGIGNAPAALPAVVAIADDILVWVAGGESLSVYASVRDTDVTIQGDQAGYMALLALRVVGIVEDLKARITYPVELRRNRLLLLIDTLTQHSEDFGDPPFLSRMTFVLRAFPQHFRNQDSWKVLVRFRHILDCLLPTALEELRSKNLAAADFHCPADTPSKILESWAQWRNWDVPNVAQTLAFKTLFGGDVSKMMEDPTSRPVTLRVRSEYIRLAIQSTSKTSEIVIEETSMDLDITPPTVPTGLMLVEENERTKTVMHLHVDNIAFLLDWSLSHVAENFLPLIDRINQLTKQSEDKTRRGPASLLEDGLDRHVFHIVIRASNSSITLQSINLRHMSRAEGLQMSLIGTNQAGERYGHGASVLVNAHAAVTELHGPSNRLWHTLLASPSLYIDHLQARKGFDLPPSVTVAAAYKDLEVAITEQLPDILHVADSVIVDEVPKMMHLIDRAKRASDATVDLAPKPQTQTSREPMSFNVGLLAGHLQLEVSLLQALAYRLEGTPGSFRVEPSMDGDNHFSMDFDIGRQSHSFINLSMSERHSQGLIELPHINGQVGFQKVANESSITVATTIERIEIDAAAVQSVVGIMNKLAVRNVISAVKAGVKDIRHDVDKLNLIPDQQRARPSTEDRRTSFDARVALLGVRVSASTPRNHERSTAEMEFGIGPLHATASNRSSINGGISLIPEVRARIQDIGAKLWIDDAGDHQPCGHMSLSIMMDFAPETGGVGRVGHKLNVRSEGLEADVFPDTASTVVDVINQIQDQIRDLDFSTEVDYLKRFRDSRRGTVIQQLSGRSGIDESASFSAEDLLAVTTTLQLRNVRISWRVAQRFAHQAEWKAKDVVLSFDSIDFTTRGGHEARLTIHDTILQLSSKERNRKKRSLNSALLPLVAFSVGYWSSGKKFSLAFKASGKPLDLKLDSKFIKPVSAVHRSIDYAIERFKRGTAKWQGTPTATGGPRAGVFDIKRIASLLIEADFAGAQVFMQGGRDNQSKPAVVAASAQERGPRQSGHAQSAADERMMFTSMRAPGIALKLEYNTNGHQPSVNGELRIDASSNTLRPNVVPLLLEISASVQEVVQSQENAASAQHEQPSGEGKGAQRFFEDESIITANPAAIFGKTKVDLGLRLCKQEFGLSCQPIARVDAKATIDDLYFAINTIDSEEHGHFFAVSASITKLTASVKHVYSREPTFSYEMDSVTLSLMNSKHLSGVNGVSAILNIDPTKLSVNGKQLQDLLLFREIWLPPEMRSAQSQPAMLAPVSTRPEDYLMQRYQVVAAAAAFPWNATVSVAELSVELDLGQSIGKSSFSMKNLWASQQKSSNWEQNLCIGLEEMGMTSVGRMSGFVSLSQLAIRMSIKWPQDAKEHKKTPLIQASTGFQRLRTKAAFDYQAFAFGDIEGFDFLMYNVRDSQSDFQDRLVAVLDCEKAYVFCTSTSPAQAVGLYQAFDRLIEEKQRAYMQSLTEVERHLRRESTISQPRAGSQSLPSTSSVEPAKSKRASSISLHTDVVLTLRTLSVGVYPSTFFDSQILKLEANSVQTRFAVGLENGKIHSGLGMTLGQLQVGLAPVKRPTTVPKALDVSVDDVIASAVNAKGGTIVRVPQVVASMQTWQAPDSNKVDYIFKSLFDGKIDVGWNLARINFITGMWTTHSRALASRLGRSLPESAVKITAGREGRKDQDMQGSEKITAQVNLPQSRYEYRPLEPPIIETPQLRDMGEATPPLEWIGLQRDRLPNVTHQIIIVSLVEVAKEVEDAYERILGSS